MGDNHMPKLRACRFITFDKFVSDDDSTAHTRSESKQNTVVNVSSRTVNCFTERGDVSVVRYSYFQPGSFFHAFGNMKMVPSEVIRKNDYSVFTVDHPRDAHSDTDRFFLFQVAF